MAKNRRISNSLLTQDLMSLIKLLDKYHFTDDIMSKYPLENLLNIRQTGKLTDNVQIDDIAFKLKTDSWNTSPYVNDAVLTASLSYKYIENLENIEKDGLFSHYQLEFLLRGEGNDNKNHMSSWHLDREECIEGTFHHPLYHFHSGGHKIKDCDKGDLIIIGSPRLAHPPMDVFLMIHFIIENFFNKKTYSEQVSILENEEYQMIIEHAQKRVLDPYYSAIVNNQSSVGLYSAHNLCPLYY